MPVERTGPPNPVPKAPHPTSGLLRGEAIRYLILGLIGFVLVLRLLICGSTCGTGINLLLTSFILLAFLVWLMRQTLQGEIKLVKTGGLGALLLVWALLILVSLGLSPYKFGSFPYVFIWLGDIILFYLLIQYSAEFSDAPRWCLQALLATAFIITLYALYQYTYGLEELRQTIARNPDLIRHTPSELKDEFFSRIKANEPFATFLYQNSLAGFLVLILPIVIGLVISSRRVNLKLIIQASFVILMIFVLIKTGSRGAWVASLISFLVLIILLIWRYLKKTYRALILISGGLILALGLLTFGLIITNRTPEFLVNLSESLKVRFEYWQGAWQVIKHNLWTGVGLNHFAYHYPIYKSAAAGETTHVHNGFLAIWAEFGLLGFVTFCAIWTLILIRASKKQLTHQVTLPPHPNPLPIGERTKVRGLSSAPIIVLILAAGIAFALAEVLQGTFVLSERIPWLFPVLFLILWVVCFLLFCFNNGIKRDLTDLSAVSGRCIPTQAGRENQFNQLNPVVHSGIMAGIIGFLIHTTVDFNLYEPGLSLTLWFTAGCLMTLTLAINKETPNSILRIKMGGIEKFFIIVGSLTLMGIIGLGIVPRLVKEEILLEEGVSLLHSKDSMEVKAGVESIREANQINPYDVRPWLELARLYYRAKPKGQSDLPAPRRTSGQAGEEFESLAQTYIDRAVSLSPFSSPLYSLQGTIWEETARGYDNQAAREKDPLRQRELRQLKDEALKKSVEAFRQTTQLYPTRPENWYRLGRILEESGTRDKARSAYEQALKLHNQVTLPRLKFSPAKTREIRERLENLR